MKSTLAIILTLVGLQAHAADTATFVGTDGRGQECSIEINAKNGILSYSAIFKDGRDGYGFRLTEDVKNAFRQRQSPITINEGGFGGANLKIWIDDDGSMKVKYSNLIILRSSCENMVRNN